ncbi:MAG: ShlB/FhaC/HecB family hemolysin secretion/activation protein [Hyphomicrobiales bacterium]|nr:ShlB/FhaC/HecB family hemolysin secretion/activation protein [Hyphomicrobiales bacterium]
MRISSFHFALNLALGTALMTSVAFPAFSATEAQRLPGVIDRSLEDAISEEKIQQEDTAPAEIRGAKEPELEIKKGDDKEKVATINTIRFSGNTVVDDAMLQEVAQGYLGRPLTKADLAKLKYDLTRAFYDRGYILVKVITPPQDLSDGTMDVEIYEAKIGEVTTHNEGVVRPFLVRAIVRKVETGKVFNEDDAEEMVRGLNDLKGVQASVNLQPSSEFLRTDLHVAVEKADEDENYVMVDNYGAELTGRNIATVHLEKSNLLGIGETFSFHGRHSNDNLWSTEFGFTAPLGLSNVRLETSYLHSENEIGDRLAALNADGESDIAVVALASDVVNTQKLKATVRGGMETRTHKSFLSNVQDTKDDVRQAFVEGTYLRRADWGLYYGGLKVKKGVDIFGASSKGDTGNSRALGEPEAWIVQPVIYTRFEPIENGRLTALAQGQLATNTLLSSDLFVLGGYNNVRGFEPAQETGESGYNFSVEYAHTLPLSNDDWTVRFGPWFDGGTVYNRLGGQVEDKNLYSAGLGMEMQTQLHPKLDDTTLRLDWARPIGGYTSQQVESNFFYVRLKQAF